MAGYIGSKSSVTLVDGITEEGGTLTGNLSFGDNNKAIFGAGSDANIRHDGANTKFSHTGNGGLYLGADTLALQNGAHNETYLSASVNGAVSLRYDNLPKIATTSTGIQVTGNIANTSGDLTLDVSGIINLNADNGGNINLKDGVTHYGTIQNENSDLRINSIIQDKDIIFRGNDGGTGINALTLDMSAAGAATFSGKVTASARKTFAPRYENSNSYGSNFAWDRIQLGNNGTNKIIAGNTSAGGSLLFVVNNSVDLVDATTASGTNGINAMKIDSSGNVLVGTTDDAPANNSAGSTADDGFAIKSNGNFQVAKYNGTPAYINRTGNDGTLIDLRKNGSDAGSISTYSAYPGIGKGHVALLFVGGANYIEPFSFTNGSARDNAIDLGRGGARFDDDYSTTSTIQTSDFNDKQEKASLTATEMLVGKRISALFKTFRWKDSVAEKGDNARTHTGVIAQDVQAAFTAEGLDAGDYALFISSTWWEHDEKYQQ